MDSHVRFFLLYAIRRHPLPVSSSEVVVLVSRCIRETELERRGMHGSCNRWFAASLSSNLPRALTTVFYWTRGDEMEALVPSLWATNWQIAYTRNLLVQNLFAHTVQRPTGHSIILFVISPSWLIVPRTLGMQCWATETSMDELQCNLQVSTHLSGSTQCWPVLLSKTYFQKTLSLFWTHPLLIQTPHRHGPTNLSPSALRREDESLDEASLIRNKSVLNIVPSILSRRISHIATSACLLGQDQPFNIERETEWLSQMTCKSCMSCLCMLHGHVVSLSL